MKINSLLQRLVSAYPGLRDRLRPFSYVHGDVLGEIGRAIDDIIFPRSGTVSVVIPLPNGDLVECAMIGHEGAVGLGSLFGSQRHVNSSIGQMPGDGWRLKPSEVQKAIEADSTLAADLFQCHENVLVQAQQTAACNAKHQISQRLASWLLRVQAASGENELGLTQEFMAQMLGVQRATLSVAANGFQDMDLITYRRGRIRILDVDGLAGQSCGCHRLVVRRRSGLTEEAAAVAINGCAE